MESLQKLLMHELEDLYDAEQQILKALPRLIDESSSPELQQALTKHQSVTEKQVARLDQVFRTLGEERGRTKCKGMAGLIAEGEDLLKEDFEAATKDAGIIGTTQRVEHYEISGYGTARTLAATLGNMKVAHMLEETLDEEKEADRLLTQIAEASINPEAEREQETGGGNGRMRRRQSSSRPKTRNTRQRSRRTRSRSKSTR